MANLPCEVLYLLTKKIYNVYSPPLGGGPNRDVTITTFCD